jgi:hypothetical protein
VIYIYLKNTLRQYYTLLSITYIVFIGKIAKIRIKTNAIAVVDFEFLFLKTLRSLVLYLS